MASFVELSRFAHLVELMFNYVKIDLTGEVAVPIEHSISSVRLLRMTNGSLVGADTLAVGNTFCHAISRSFVNLQQLRVFFRSSVIRRTLPV